MCISTEFDMEKVLKEIEERNLVAIRFEQTVTTGISLSKLVPAYNFKEVSTKGMNYVLVHLDLDTRANLVEGSVYGEDIGFADGVAFPDFNTFVVLPWYKRIGRVLIEPTFKGESVEGHPRMVARRQLEKLKSLGISLLSAHEFEFYLLNKDTLQPINDDTNANATTRDTPIMDLMCDFIEYLPQVGAKVERLENEMGPGQLEVTYKPALGLRAADNAHTFKTSVKEIALLKGYVATFMTKPYADKSGSSGHFCHSLWDTEGKISLLYDHNDPTKLSEVGKHWIAGLVAHAPAITVLTSPTVNCIKRLKPWTVSPINATWGMDNRTVAFRVKINGEQGTYFENRIGAAGCNPYLSLAATVAAGFDGIVNKLELPPAVTRNAYREEDLPPNTQPLPTTMEDALQALLDDKVICDALGEEFMKCFTAAKKHDIKVEKEALAKGEENWEFNYFFRYL